MLGSAGRQRCREGRAAKVWATHGRAALQGPQDNLRGWCAAPQIEGKVLRTLLLAVVNNNRPEIFVLNQLRILTNKIDIIS